MLFVYESRSRPHDNSHDLDLLNNDRSGCDAMSSSNDRFWFLGGDPAGGLAALQPCMKEFLG
jgi:hypothetical protein